MLYRLVTDFDGVLRLSDMAWIPNDPANRDWAEYQVWRSAGNKPQDPE